MIKCETIHCNVLIIGGGIAGSTTAIALSEYIDNIILVVKDDDMTTSNTYQAQGGIVYVGEKDSAELLKKDIMYAGDGLCNEEAVDILCQKGPALVKEILIDKLGIEFSKTESGELDLTEEGAHSVRRIIHFEDRTGKKIQDSLNSYIAKNKKITILKEHIAVDLLTRDHHSDDLLARYKDNECLGAYVFDNNKKVKKIISKATVLATGGLGQIYLHTSNPHGANGDGIAMAWRCGAKLINMEFTQFHPTTLYHEGNDRFLISESVRGEGAILRNQAGVAFMKNYHKMRDLAPRDVVTIAILQEMFKNYEKFVYLDTSKLKVKDIQKRFPNIYKNCLSYGIDISQEELIPVVPAYHFLCGGIRVNNQARTNVKRLYAVGEVACTGIHGANRLASTSLLEGLTFGKICADDIFSNWKNYNTKFDLEIKDWIDTSRTQEPIDFLLINQDWTTLKNIMWNYLGPIRSQKRLKRALSDLQNLLEGVETFYRDYKLTRSTIELRNAIQVGLILCNSVWRNKISRGSHYRID